MLIRRRVYTHDGIVTPVVHETKAGHISVRRRVQRPVCKCPAAQNGSANEQQPKYKSSPSVYRVCRYRYRILSFSHSPFLGRHLGSASRTAQSPAQPPDAGILDQPHGALLPRVATATVRMPRRAAVARLSCVLGGLAPKLLRHLAVLHAGWHPLLDVLVKLAARDATLPAVHLSSREQRRQR